MSVAVEASAHDEKHMFSKLVAMAVGSRGSWLSVLDIARSSIFIDGDFLRHISKWFNSLLKSVAKLSKVEGNMDELCAESSKMWAHTARVAEEPVRARWWHCEVMSGKIIKQSYSTDKKLEHWFVLVLACMPINQTDLKKTGCS